MEKIVITGEGIVCAIGTDKQSVLHALLKGESGVGTMCHLHSVRKELPVGEVKLSNDEMKAQLSIALPIGQRPLDPADRELSRTSLMGMLAIKQALEDSKLMVQSSELNAQGYRTVLVSGTTVGGMDVTENLFASLKESDACLQWLNNHDPGSSTRQMANHFGVFDEYTTISTACSSAANAIIAGAEMIRSGEADIVVAGGAEALTRFHLNGFNSLMIIDSERCRPFDRDRAGLNLGEGAAYVVLESEASARKRNAPIHAELAGWSNACDAFHQTATSPEGEGPYLAMTQAIAMAGLQPADIQYVNAHGTGTPDNDRSESVALRRVFGSDVPPVSSTKPFTGHTTSASGSIETVISLLAIQNGFIPANLGWKHPMDEGVKPSFGVREAHLDAVLCNAFGFGGNDSALVLRAPQAPLSSPLGGMTQPAESLSPQRASEGAFLSPQGELEGAFLSPQGESEGAFGRLKVLSRVEINDEEELKEIRNYVSPMESRRMGKLLKSSLLASLKALSQAGIETPDAIVTATSQGCLENSERLLEQLESEGETATLSPTLFMQSTHNTLGCNIAIRTGCHGYNVTYTQGAESLEWALRDARRLLRSGKCNNVLVGCHDEMTPLFASFVERLQCHTQDGRLGEGFLRRGSGIRSVAMVLAIDNDNDNNNENEE